MATIVDTKSKVLYNRNILTSNKDRVPPIINKMSGNLYEKTKRVGKHTRKTKVALGKESYTSPKLVLSSDFNKYIGEKYKPFHVELKTEQGEFKGILIVLI